MNAPRLLLVPAFLLCLAADWPRFRGPNGAGISDDKDVPVKWKDENFLWKAELPGAGHSSPIVIKGKVILQAATLKERILVCYDAASGKQLWKTAVPGARGRTHPKSSLASSTPASDGERVYIVYWDGEAIALHAYTLDGKPAWDRPLGKFKSQHGPGHSPVVVGGKVVVNNDQDGKAELLAFDAKTGKPAWRVQRKAYRACYSTPFLSENGQLIVTTTTGLTGYDPAEGKPLWNYQWKFPVKPLRTVGSAVISGGLLFAASGDGDGSRNMVAIKLGGKGDITDTATAWQLDKSTAYVPSVLARGDHLYTVYDPSGGAFAICREAKSGKETWRYRLGSDVSASPVLIDGKWFIFGERGDVTVLEATPKKATVVAKNNLGEKVLSSPAVANGRLYVRGGKHLFCIGKPDSK